MALYVIAYDLRDGAKESDYKGLHDVIKGFGDWYHLQYSTWIVDTVLTAENMSDQIRAVYQPESSLVWRLTSSDHQGWLQEDGWEWINSRLF